MPVNHTIQAAGRWIWGSPLVSRIKMNQNVTPAVPALDANGNKVDQWSFGVAYTKQDFAQHIWPALEWEARSVYPNGIPQDFAWKFKDGDTGLDANNGKPLRDKEGYAGHMVLGYLDRSVSRRSASSLCKAHLPCESCAGQFGVQMRRLRPARR
jgi:hypothetical protein